MRVIVSQVIVPCAIRVLGQHLVSSKLCALSPVSIYVLGALDRVHSTQRRIHSAVSRSTMPCPYVVRLPSTGKSQVLLCAATFKFRCHFIFLFSWSLAFSRPKNGPDRITGSHSAAKRRFQRSARHATSEGGHEQASDTVSASLARREHTLAVHHPPPLAFHRSYYGSSPRL